MLRVSDDLLDFDVEQVFYYEGKPFTGISVEEYNDRVLSELHYRDGLQEGKAQDWYPTGEPRGISYYSQGSLHGRTQEWYRDGKRKREAMYEYGILVREMQWNENGDVIKDYELSEESPPFSLLQLRRGRRTY